MYHILFIDSGVGGLSTLATTIKSNPQNCLYFADTSNAPYGNKPVSFLRQRLIEIIQQFLKSHPLKIVVLACNTATITCIQHLRQTFSQLIFVGTEPAINVAHKQGFKQPTIIATPQTISNLQTIDYNYVRLIACKNLASVIEHYTLSPNPVNTYNLLCELYSLKQKITKSDCIVLGCTHYSLITKIFSYVFNQVIIDGNNGVSRRINSLLTQQKAKYRIKIITSSKNYQELQKYKKILKQILANPINL